MSNTELLTYENKTGDMNRRRFIRDGVAGNYEVIFEMVRVIRNSVKDYRVKNIAAEILLTHHLDSYSSGEKILRTIFNYVANDRDSKVAYINDPKGAVESVKSAYRTLFDRFGDCDDLTVTLCSLIASVGFENSKICIALAKYSPADTSFSHVYAVVYTGGKRYALDASLPNAKFDTEIPFYEVQEIDVFGEIAGIDGFSGIWTNAKYLARNTASKTLGAIPNLINYIPLGFVSSAALAGGANLLSSTKQSKSLSETASAINKKLDKLILELVNSQIALDLAQSEAVRVVSQLTLVQDVSNSQDFATVKTAINEKLTFIKDFERIAKIHGFKVTYLNSNAMLVLGIGAGAYGAWSLYKLITRGKE